MALKSRRWLGRGSPKSAQPLASVPGSRRVACFGRCVVAGAAELVRYTPFWLY